MEVPKSFLENNKFEIISSIGGQKKRKLNKVFLVKDKNSNQQFFLKSIDKVNSSSESIQLLKNESKQDFSSSYLPKVIEIFEDEKYQFKF